MTYVVRLYEGWQVWDGQIAEMTISATSIEEAQKLAEKIANGRAFSCNKAWEEEEMGIKARFGEHGGRIRA